MTQKLVYANADGSISVVHPAPGVAMADVIKTSVPVKLLRSAIVAVGVATPYQANAGDYMDARIAEMNQLSVEVVPYRLVAEADIPADRLFRAAWRAGEEAGVVEDTATAQEVAHELRRQKREEEFAPLDKQITIVMADPVKVAEVEAQRQAVRDRYAEAQDAIDVCGDTAALRETLVQHSII